MAAERRGKERMTGEGEEGREEERGQDRGGKGDGKSRPPPTVISKSRCHALAFEPFMSCLGQTPQ